MKLIKQAVAIYLISPNNSSEFLIVKRPPNDGILSNVWGLPAVVLKSGENIEEAVNRVGTEKLNTQIEALSLIGTKSSDRGDYYLILSDVEAKLIGPEPSVLKSNTINTKYVDQKWTSDYSLLIDAASKGSLCTQIILDNNKISYNI